MVRPEHLRHKPPQSLERPRDLLIACPHFRSSVNLSRIVRLCGCAGIRQMIVCGSLKVDSKIARDAKETVNLVRRQNLSRALVKLREEGYRLVGLEQTDQSHVLYDYSFDRKTALVIGHERNGLQPEELDLLHDLVEIPVYGLPHSYNVVTATTMAVYEYCRQFPRG
ncbi:MAG: TrmH family RNA methyltransferase [Mariniblastus sp.]|nr:TrmH family RNA methyltransferase [Mariniblastus sp.]